MSQPDMTSTLMTLAAFVAPSVPEKWVDAVEIIESGGRGANTPPGDLGCAIGPFQFWKRAWEDTTLLRQGMKVQTYPYWRANEPTIARLYAKTWLSHLMMRLTDKLQRNPTAGETWLAYNMGMTGFGLYDYDINKVPKHKRTKALAINAAVK